ncbi:unnamed protein product [Adineta ricciae]|uniref:DUF1761 domain-containing protein n=1 Tax=Adineta ricciae TaxID=249248 RepID=A0A815MLF3_ADIRI|nr:unnamed protein product [Adineta ricciae]
MLELLPIDFTLTALSKTILIIATNMLLGYVWYSPKFFQKQWLQATLWKEGDVCDKTSILMSNVGTLFNAFLLNILLIAFDIRKHHFLSAALAAAILCGFYTFNGWNYVFFGEKSDYKRRRTLFLIEIGFTFVLYTLVSFVLVGF